MAAHQSHLQKGRVRTQQLERVLMRKNRLHTHTHAQIFNQWCLYRFFFGTSKKLTLTPKTIAHAFVHRCIGRQNFAIHRHLHAKKNTFTNLCRHTDSHTSALKHFFFYTNAFSNRYLYIEKRLQIDRRFPNCCEIMDVV